MSFSSIAVEERAKEASSVKSFLAFSLIGSLALHIGILSLGIGNLLTRMPEIEDEPIEVAIVDSPPEDAAKAPQNTLKNQKSESKSDSTSSGNILSGSAGDSGSESLLLTPPQVAKRALSPSMPPVIAETQTTSPANTSTQKFSNSLKQTPAPQQPQRVEQPKPVQTVPPKTTESSKPIEKTRTESSQTPDPTTPGASPTPITANSSLTQPPVAVEQSSEKLRQNLSGIRNSRESQEISGNSAVESDKPGGSGDNRSTVASSSETRDGTGNGSGSSTGPGSAGNGTGTGNQPGGGETQATAPTTPRLGTESENRNRGGDSEGSGNGRAACRECNTKYPESARRRGIEGRVEVAVDTDEKGNVTNVRIARSSGNRDLDEETKRQAREWRLKPASGGRQGVSIATEYAIQGSRRHRKVQEHKRQREAEQSNGDTTASNPNGTQEPPRRRRRFISGTITDVPPEPTTRQRREAVTSPQEATSRPAETTPRPRLRQEPVETNPARSNQVTPTGRSPQPAQATSNSQPVPQSLRRRRRPAQAKPIGQGRLRDALRRSRQQSESPSVAPSSGQTHLK